MKRGTALSTILRGVIRNSHVESLTAIFSGQITAILARYLPPPYCFRAGRRPARRNFQFREVEQSERSSEFGWSVHIQFPHQRACGFCCEGHIGRPRAAHAVLDLVPDLVI